MSNKMLDDIIHPPQTDYFSMLGFKSIHVSKKKRFPIEKRDY